jgi:hypothetical protein
VSQHKKSQVHRPICDPIFCDLSPREWCQFFRSHKGEINKTIVMHDINHLITLPKSLDNEATTTPSSDGGWVILTPLSGEGSFIEKSWYFVSDTRLMFLSERSSTKAYLDTDVLLSRSDLSETSDRTTPRTLFLCPFCPLISNRFRTAQGVEKHHASLAHASKIFHSPTLPCTKQGEKCFVRKEFQP